MSSIRYTYKNKENKSAKKCFVLTTHVYCDEQTLFSNTTTNIKLEGLTSTYF